MDSPKDHTIKLSTYDELFSGSPTLRSATMKRVRTLQRQSVQGGKQRELVAVLQKQRVVVDQNAIHFVAEARSGKRADARNSVFKLAQKYQVLPDTENMQRIKQLYGRVRENEDSGDEEWDKASAKLPGKLDKAAFLKLVEDDSHRESLLSEMDEINQETAELEADVVTQEEITLQQAQHGLSIVLTEMEKQFGDEEPNKDSGAESDVSFDEEDLKALNSMQREFAGNNLFIWFKDIQKAYETGVKLVKVNRMGYKFIRILTIKDMVLSIRQPTTQSQAKIDRQVALNSIESVTLGKTSKEFAALEGLVEAKKEPSEFNPKPNVCCVITLPKHRSLSLVFLDEDNRNGFVFFVRVLIRKAKHAVQQLQQGGK